MARSVLIEFRRDTAANWTSTNPTLAAGEPGFETDTSKLKIGDGSTAWTGLAYFPAAGTVTSVFGRSGAVAAANGDYAGVVASALTGATAATRYVGGTASGKPASGTFAAGDFVIDQTGTIWICTVAGTPGTWVSPAAGTGLPTGGATSQVVGYGGSAGTGAWVYPPGYQFDYAEITSVVTVTATTDGNNQGTAVIDGAAVTYDGATRVLIEFRAPYMSIGGTSGAGASVVANLYDGTTDLGRLCNVTGASSSFQMPEPASGARFLTPSAASHTYHIRAWKTAATASVGAGAGGASTYMPAFMRITKA